MMFLLRNGTKRETEHDFLLEGTKERRPRRVMTTMKTGKSMEKQKKEVDSRAHSGVYTERPQHREADEETEEGVNGNTVLPADSVLPGGFHNFDSGAELKLGSFLPAYLPKFRNENYHPKSFLFLLEKWSRN